jgi:hypothetical protein
MQKIHTMTKKIKLLIALLVLILLSLLGWQQLRLNSLQKSGQLDRVKLSMFQDSVSVLKDKNQNLTFKIQSVEVDASSARKALEASGFEIKDLRTREIKWRDLSFTLQAKIVALGKGTIILRDSITPGRVDMIPVKTGRWQDDYLTLTPILIDDSLTFTYRYQTGIRLLVDKKNTVSAYLVNPRNPKEPNPFASITTANSITFTPERHWYTNKWIYLGAGIVGGIILSK